MKITVNTKTKQIIATEKKQKFINRYGDKRIEIYENGSPEENPVEILQLMKDLTETKRKKIEHNEIL